MKIRNQEDVVLFAEAFMQEIGTAGVSMSPPLIKATSDFVNSYISLKELELEQSATEKALKRDEDEGGD